MGIDELLTLKTRRDRWGRYLVLPPGAAKPVGYTRATTIAKTLDDGAGLIGWSKRMVALGLASRPDLLGLVASIDAADRSTLNELCDRAAEAGGSTVRRDQGTAIHAALEKSWHDPSAAPAMFAAEVKAAHDALHAAGLRVVEHMAERMVVVDEYKIAGTFDLVLTDGTDLYVADVKTGSSLLGALSFAIQLSIYANADHLYTQGAAADGSEDVREPMPLLNKSKGVVLHIQPGADVCDLHWIDLGLGAEALKLAMRVREIRKSKPLTSIVPATEPKPVDRDTETAVAIEMLVASFPGAELLVTGEWRAWMRQRIANIIEAGHKASLLEVWPAGVPTLASGDDLTTGQGMQLEAACVEVEARHQMPLVNPLPHPVAPEIKPPLNEWVSRIEPTVRIDEGREVAAEEVAEVRAAINALPPEAKAWIGDTIIDCRKVAKPIRLTGRGGVPTERRLAIAWALVGIAELGEDIITALLVRVTDGEIASIPKAIGSLSIDQAMSLSILAISIDRGEITIAYELDGSVSLHGEQAA